MPRQTSIQLTEATERQVQALQAAGFGSFTDIARIAIDRMHKEEMQTMKKYSQQQLQAAAHAAVERAKAQPGVWQFVQGFDDQVVFANEVYTVGSNGMVDDFQTAYAAGNALAELFIEQANLEKSVSAND